MTDIGDGPDLEAAPASAASVSTDNAHLYEEARGWRQWVETVSELTHGLLSGEDADDMLAALVQRVRRLTGADLAVIALSESAAGQRGSDSLLIVAADGTGAERLRGAVVDAEDARTALIFEPEQRGPCLVARLEAGDRARGVLALYRRPGGAAFEAEITQLTTDLAVRAAMALELAERREHDGLLSEYADRDRIGRDLQDLAVQRLFAASMSLQSAQRITQEPVVADRISQAIADLDDTVTAIRWTSFALQAHEPRGFATSGRSLMAGEHESAAGAFGFPPATMAAGPPRAGGQPPRHTCTGAPNSPATRLPHGWG